MKVTAMKLVEELSLLNSAGVTVIAARPGIGKTTLAVNIAQHCVLHEQLPIAFFSLELSKKKLVEKINLPQTKLFIDDTAKITVSEIHQKCREQKDKHDLGLIVIDYFQLLDGEKADEKAEGLKDMSLDLGVPIVVTSQLSRSFENCRPCLTTAFGESGALVNIADNVIFLYREESGECELIIAKSKKMKEGI